MTVEKNPFAKFLTHFKKGDVLFREGDEGEEMFIIQSGRIAIKKQVKDGDTVLDFVFSHGNCSLGIMPGLHYVFFIHPENRLVLWPGGSRGYVNMDGSVPKADLARLRAFARKIEPTPNR